MSEHDERLEDDADPGFLGGGGIAETIDPTDEDDDEAHLADTDHGEL